jgi:hypothetical protein
MPPAKAAATLLAATMVAALPKASSASLDVQFREETSITELLTKAIVQEFSSNPGRYLCILASMMIILAILLAIACICTVQTCSHKSKISQLKRAAARQQDDQEEDSAAAGAAPGPGAADLSQHKAHRGNPEFQHACKEVRTVGVMSPVHYSFGSPEPRYFHQTQGFSRAWEMDIGTPFPAPKQRCLCSHCSRSLF